VNCAVYEFIKKVVRFHCVDSAAAVIVDSNHVDVPDVHMYDNHELASPDSDHLQLPVVPDAPRTAGLYLVALWRTVSDTLKAVFNVIVI